MRNGRQVCAEKIRALQMLVRMIQCDKREVDVVEIAIVEDQRQEADILKKLLSDYAATHDREFAVEWFDEPKKFLDAFDGKFDLVFLDIQMPDINGMDVARKIRERDTDVIIVFVTNMIQYAVEGYSVQASDFIVKPAVPASV